MNRIIFMQSINFEHLRPRWPDLASLCAYAEHYVASDPQSPLIKLRCFAELLVGEVYSTFRLPTYPNDKFMDRLQSSAFEASVGDKAILDKLHAIRKTGNRAAHEGKFGMGDSLWLLKEVHILSYWLLLITKKGSKADIKGFELPQTANDKQLAKKDAEHKARLEQAKAREEKAAQENAELKQQLSETEKDQNQAASQRALSHLELNEAETRRQLIDRDLYSAGWNIDLINNANTEEVWREVKVLDQPTNSGEGYCDYVLWDADGKPLAVVEAKRTRESANKGRKQAELYADALEKEHGQRPVIFLTNGKDIYILDDVQGYGLRKLYGFYSKESVQYLIRQRTTRGDLLSPAIRTDIAIAISVDMLDTGIDVPEVLNLVFAKPVKSKVKFWQMIGRGTRLSENLFGPGLHKSKFLIFDHWANFEYFELNHEDEDARPVKSLSQKLFEARVRWAETALRKAEMDQFYAAVDLIKQDIDTLDDNGIAIKDNWRIKSQYQDIEVLKQFAPVTKNALYDQVAPLMQWRNIQGKSEALRWDMEVISAQQALLDKSDDVHEIRAKIQYKMGRMAMHRNEVRQKAETIRVLQQDDFWQKADFEQLEKARLKLRDVIHLRQKETPPPPGPNHIYDIQEYITQIQIAETKTNIRNVDYEIYRQEVEKTLEPLFNQNPILQKIRAGEPITEDEVHQLNALVYTQNARVDLKLLKEFFPESSAGIDQLLRTIIGLDVAPVEKKFEQFVQEHHIRLNSLQQRFLALLKSEICTTGQISVSRLYEQPFTSLHQDGIDGVFQDAEAHLIANFVAGFMVETKKQKQSIQVQSTEKQ